MKTRWKGIVATLTVSLMAACSTPAPSQLMTNVENDLNSSQRDALETQFPRLIAEAEDALEKGRKALENGDSNKSELYVSIANSKYQAALNLSKSKEISHQRAAYEDALASLEDEVNFLAREAEELERYNRLEERFQDATERLDQYEGLEAEARESLALARKKQGAALREGAPQMAEKPYQEGEMLTQSALSALERDDFESTIELSGQATSAFEEAIAASKDSAVAQRRRAEESETRRKSRNEEREEALDLIEKAVEMKSAALAEGADEREPNVFQQGDFLLSRAEMALQDERFDQADESAKKAASSFEKAIKAKEETPTPASADRDETSEEPASQMATRTQRPRSRSSQADASNTSNRSEAVRLITRAQMQRAEALGRGEDESCPNTFQEFEAVLDIARQRLDSGDHSSAIEHAIRAQERLRLCTQPRGDSQGEAASERGSEDSAAQRSTAQRSAAQQRSDAQGSAAQSSTDEAEDSDEDEEKLSPLERAARDRAIKAMTEADLALARAEFRGTSRSSISRATSLKDSAEKWFDREDYPRATLFADLVVEQLSPAEESEDKDKAQRSSSMTVAERAARMTAEKTAEETAEKSADAKQANRSGSASESSDETATECPKNEALANFLNERSQNQKIISESRGDSSWQPPTSLRAANTLNEEGKCERAREFYLEAANELDQGDKSAPERAAQKSDSESEKTEQSQSDDDEKTSTDKKQAVAQKSATDTKQPRKVDEAARQRALTSLAESRRKLASLGDKADGPALEVSSRLVERSQDAFESGRFENAYVLSQQALGAMESVSSTEEQSDDRSARWKGAYQTVLDALIARDRAKTLVNDETNEVFERGVGFLEKARDSWSSKDFQTAERFAKAAIEDFQNVRDNAREAEKKAAEAKAAREEQARKEAAQEKASEQEKAQRDEAQRDEAAKQKAQTRADEALRQASVDFELCKEKNCRSRDSRAYLSGTQMLEDAREARKSKNFEEAARLASEASQNFQKVLEMEVELTPATSENLNVTDGEIALSPRIKFDLGSTSVSQESMQGVRALADYLQENDAALETVTIIGHTDSKGNAENNRELSRKRAQSVADTLRSLGVKSSLLKVVGMGESQPIATNETAEGRSRNRRVEIRYELRGE